ncbi:MAG: hypothetical protein MUO89_02355 [Dehalococcoidia bacterium]|nr:hypothetical protein [Dehalococcoidia bacterium]
MKKDSSEEKLFLEYLDRLLAGEDITVGGEVSHETRAALEHARKMLAFREEPSAEFRAELRNRLLRQIADRQASAGRAGFWERFDSVLPPRPVLVAVTSTVAVLFLAFIGVVWFAGRFAAAPSVTMSPPPVQPPSEYSVRLPANNFPQDVSFTAKTSLSASAGQAAIYEVESSQVTVASVTELGRRLGFTGQASLSHDGTKIVMSQGSGDEARQLTVWTASGAVEYGYVEPGKLYPSVPVELPSQQDAEAVAYDFLQQADLLPPDYHSLAKVEKDTTVAAGGGYSVSQRYAAAAAPPAPSWPWEKTEPSAPPGTTYWLVSFPYFVDGMEATGPGSKIEVSVGDNGEVVGMLWSWRPLSSLGTDSIISQKQAYEELLQGKGSLEVPLDCKKVVVNRVQLKYWLDPPSEKQDFIVPVYEFTGTCLDKNGNTLEDFTGWTPALATN